MGDKRSGDEIDTPSSKQRRINSPTPPPTLGFQHVTTSAFTSLSCTSLSSVASSSSHSLGLLAPRGYICSGFPSSSSDCRLIDANQWGHFRSIVSDLKCDDPRGPSFMSQRAGSTLIPSPLGEFNKNLGAQLYIPCPVLRLKDDSRDPLLARSLMDSLVTPLRYAEAHSMSSLDLARACDSSMVDALTNTSLMRQSFFRDHEILTQEVRTLTGRVDKAGDMLARTLEELKNEKATVASLTSQLGEKDAELCEKDIKIECIKDELQREIEVLKMTIEGDKESKRELAEEVDNLKVDLEYSASSRRELLASFPELLRRTISHSDIMGIIKKFNQASIDCGKLAAYQAVLKNYDFPDHQALSSSLDPSCLERLKEARDLFLAQEFPILKRITGDLGASVDDLFALFETEAVATS